MEKPEDLSVRRVPVRRIGRLDAVNVWDEVAIEEPLETRIHYWFKETQQVQSLGLTMRTPGQDRELVLGYLLSEGVIQTRSDVLQVRHLGGDLSNEVVAELAKHVDVEGWRLARGTYINSSCGVCGKRSVDALSDMPSTRSEDMLTVDAGTIIQMPDRLRKHQEAFAKTGGLHAAALATATGEIQNVFEDVGRHNALDKLLGWCIEESQIPLRSHIVFLSSRSSFELIQKLVRAGGLILAAVGAPSSLAIDTARAYGITLVGFIRDARFNVYSGEWRIKS